MTKGHIAKHSPKGIVLRKASTRGVLEAWRNAYYKGDKWKVPNERIAPVLHYEEVYRRLTKLPSDATPEDFAKVIGNKTWTHLQCSSCNERVAEAVEVGQQGWTTDEILICEPCLAVAKQAFSHPPGKPVPKLPALALDDLFEGAKIVAGTGSNCLQPGKLYTVKATPQSKTYKWCVVCDEGRDHYVRPRENVQDGKTAIAAEFFQRKGAK